MLQIELPSQHRLMVPRLLVLQNLMVRHLLALQNLLLMLLVLSGVHLRTHLRTKTSSNKLAQLLLPQVLLMKIRYNLRSASNENVQCSWSGMLVGYKHECYRKLLELYEYMFVFPYSFWGYLHMPKLTNLITCPTKHILCLMWRDEWHHLHASLCCIVLWSSFPI